MIRYVALFTIVLPLLFYAEEAHAIVGGLLKAVLAQRFAGEYLTDEKIQEHLADPSCQEELKYTDMSKRSGAKFRAYMRTIDPTYPQESPKSIQRGPDAKLEWHEESECRRADFQYRKRRNQCTPYYTWPCEEQQP